MGTVITSATGGTPKGDGTSDLEVGVKELGIMDGLLWSIDSKRLKSSDKVVVSPSFSLELPHRTNLVGDPNHEATVAMLSKLKFRLNLCPMEADAWYDQGSFKSSGGHA